MGAEIMKTAKQVLRGFMGEHAHTVKMILAKVPR